MRCQLHLHRSLGLTNCESLIAPIRQHQTAANVRIRFADQRDTVVAIPVVRRILPPLAERSQPTEEMLISVVMEANKAHRNRQVVFIVEILLGPAASLGLIFYLFRLWRTKAAKTG